MYVWICEQLIIVIKVLRTSPKVVTGRSTHSEPIEQEPSLGNTTCCISSVLWLARVTSHIGGSVITAAGVLFWPKSL